MESPVLVVLENENSSQQRPGSVMVWSQEDGVDGLTLEAVFLWSWGCASILLSLLGFAALYMRSSIWHFGDQDSSLALLRGARNSPPVSHPVRHQSAPSPEARASRASSPFLGITLSPLPHPQLPLHPHTPLFPTLGRLCAGPLRPRGNSLKGSGWRLLTPPPGSLGTEPQVSSILHVPPPSRLTEEGHRWISCRDPRASPPLFLPAKAVGGRFGTYLWVEPASGRGTRKAQEVVLPPWLPPASCCACPLPVPSILPQVSPPIFLWASTTCGPLSPLSRSGPADGVTGP